MVETMDLWALGGLRKGQCLPRHGGGGGKDSGWLLGVERPGRDRTGSMWSSDQAVAAIQAEG